MSEEAQRRSEADPDPVASNRVLWDEWTEIHVASGFYDVEGFKPDGVIRLEDYERWPGDLPLMFSLRPTNRWVRLPDPWVVGYRGPGVQNPDGRNRSDPRT